MSCLSLFHDLLIAFSWAVYRLFMTSLIPLWGGGCVLTLSPGTFGRPPPSAFGHPGVNTDNLLFAFSGGLEGTPGPVQGWLGVPPPPRCARAASRSPQIPGIHKLWVSPPVDKGWGSHPPWVSGRKSNQAIVSRNEFKVITSRWAQHQHTAETNCEEL